MDTGETTPTRDKPNDERVRRTAWEHERAYVCARLHVGVYLWPYGFRDGEERCDYC